MQGTGNQSKTRSGLSLRFGLTLAAIAGALALPSAALGAAPTVTTGPASNVTATSVTLRGTVNAQDHPATWHFEYATNSEFHGGTYPNATTSRSLSIPLFGQEVPILFVTSGVSENVTGLRSGTTYHFRLVASNSDGTAFGQDQTFKTLR